MRNIKLPYRGVALTFEFKSVNHRFLDTVFRLPKDWLFIEPALKKLVREKNNTWKSRVLHSISRNRDVATRSRVELGVISSIASRNGDEVSCTSDFARARSANAYFVAKHDLFLNVKIPKYLGKSMKKNY